MGKIYETDSQGVSHLIVDDTDKARLSQFELSSGVSDNYLSTSESAISNLMIYGRSFKDTDGLHTVKNLDVEVSDGTNTQTVQTNLQLNAIPVTSGGNITIDGQMYLADVVDVEKGIVTRNVGTVLLGDLSWQVYGQYLSQYLFYADDLIGLIQYYPQNQIFTLCEGYNSRKDVDIRDLQDKEMRVRGSDGRLYFNDLSYTDATTFKNHFTDTDYLYYELATPTTETLSYQKELKLLNTFDGTTILSITSDDLSSKATFNYCNSDSLITDVEELKRDMPRELDEMRITSDDEYGYNVSITRKTVGKFNAFVLGARVKSNSGGFRVNHFNVCSADRDGNGNVITTTYAKAQDLADLIQTLKDKGVID